MKFFALFLLAIYACIVSISSLPRPSADEGSPEIFPEDSIDYGYVIKDVETPADFKTRDAERELQYDAVVMDGNKIAHDKEFGDNTEFELHSRVRRAIKKWNKGGVDVNTKRDRGKETRVDAKAKGTLWKSKDGKGRVEAQGLYGRTYGGWHGTESPQYEGSFRYSPIF